MERVNRPLVDGLRLKRIIVFFFLRRFSVGAFIDVFFLSGLMDCFNVNILDSLPSRLDLKVMEWVLSIYLLVVLFFPNFIDTFSLVWK